MERLKGIRHCSWKEEGLDEKAKPKARSEEDKGKGEERMDEGLAALKRRHSEIPWLKCALIHCLFRGKANVLVGFSGMAVATNYTSPEVAKLRCVARGNCSNG